MQPHSAKVVPIQTDEPRRIGGVNVADCLGRTTHVRAEQDDPVIKNDVPMEAGLFPIATDVIRPAFFSRIMVESVERP